MERTHVSSGRKPAFAAIHLAGHRAPDWRVPGAAIGDAPGHRGETVE
jgi:hypothetical protein